MKLNAQRRGALALSGLLVIGAVSAAGVSAVASSAGVNNDKRVKLSQAPEAVRQTILKHAKRGDIEKIERSREDGKVVYEVDVEGPNGDYEFVVGADGRFLGKNIEHESDHQDMDRDQDHNARAMDKEDQDADAAENVTVISIEAAPRAVRDAFEDRSDDANATRVERIMNEGVTKYEIEYAKRGGTASMTFTDRGEIMEVETPVRIKDVPEAILKELSEEHPGVKIEQIDEVQTFHYEMDVLIDGKKMEIAASASGEIEDHHNGEDGER